MIKTNVTRLHGLVTSLIEFRKAEQEGIVLKVRDSGLGIIIMMPEMDGIQMCKQIKEDPKLNHIPFICSLPKVIWTPGWMIVELVFAGTLS